MLLVDDDQARDPVQRREHGRPRADHNVDLAAADPMPLVVALARGQPAVLNSHALAERPSRKVDVTAGVSAISGTSTQHAAAARRDVPGEAHVHLGLAAAGHAVQQRYPKGALLGGQGTSWLVERRPLLGRHRRARGRPRLTPPVS